MAMIKDKIKEAKHTDWVVCTLGLHKTCIALHEYVKDKIDTFTHSRHQSVQNSLTQDEFDHINPITGCMRRGLQFKVKENKQQTQNKDKWEWKHGCQKCKDSFKKIITLHIGGNRLHLENCDDTSGIPLEWTIARMFMPQGNKNNIGPEDTDPAALLYIMLNCDLFTNPIRKSYKNVLADARNKLHHSPDNKVEAGDKDYYFDHMEGILTDASNDNDVDKTIRDAVVKDIEEIKKLRHSEISMTLYDDALKLKRKTIHDEFEKCLSNIENEEDMQQLRDLLDLAVKAGADLQALNDEMKNIGLYKKEMEQIKKILKEERGTHEEIIKNLRLKCLHLFNEFDYQEQNPHNTSFVIRSCRWMQVGVVILFRSVIYEVFKLSSDGILVIVVTTMLCALMLRMLASDSFEAQ